MDTLNPLTLLDNLLADYIGPKGRRAIHSLILLAGLIVTIYLAAGRNWEQAIITLVLSLYAEANRANTPAVDLDPAGEDSVPDDGLSYEQVGGADYPSDDSTGDYAAAQARQANHGEPGTAFGKPFPPVVSGEPVIPVSGNDESV